MQTFSLYALLQGGYAHLGACEYPGLRAAISRPYKADTLIRVLPEIRDYGRMLCKVQYHTLQIVQSHGLQF